MTASVKTSGSQAATLDTEHVVATVTDAGTYAFVVDAANMALGDTLTLRIYGKARSGDGERLLYVASFSNVQDPALLMSIPVVSPHHAKFTLEQTDGVGRTYPWAVYAL